MKITFETEDEKVCLEHILSDWINYCIEDPLGCQPVCRDETSPSCRACISKEIREQLDNNMLDFAFLGGEEFIVNTDIEDNRDSYYRVIDRFTKIVNVKELHEKSRAIPNAYPGFVIGIIRYASTDESRKDKILEYLKSNPSASASDVAKFVMEQDDFHEAAESTRKR